VLANGVPLVPGLPIPPLPKSKPTKDQAMFTAALQSFVKRQARGQATPSPFGVSMKNYPKVLGKAGLRLTPGGNIVAKPGAKQQKAGGR
jgi:hypothetical protein